MMKSQPENTLEALQQQKAALDQHAFVSMTDAAGRITYVNDKFVEISGYSREELIGQTHSLINSGTHPAGFFQQMYDAITRGTTWHGEVCNRTKDGCLYWVAATVVPFMNDQGEPQHYLAIRSDITRRKDAEAELALHRDHLLELVAQKTDELLERTEQINAISDLSPNGFLVFDRERKVQYVNPAFLRLTGLEEASLLGLDESAFFERLSCECKPQSRLSSIPALLAAMGDAGTCNGMDTTEDVGCRQVIELVSAGQRVLEVRMRTKANIKAQILYFRDMTHETEVDRMKSEFLSAAAHELRTPMTSIFGYSELLLANHVPAMDRAECLYIIHRESALMIEILNELLDLARIDERRGTDFNLTTLDIRSLVDDVVRDCKPPAERALPTVLASTNTCWVRGDSDKLMQAVRNVLANAYKYSTNAGVVEVELLDNGQTHDAPMVGIRIKDQGIGMTAEQRSRMFERFYRADASGQISGTGLGLSIVKEVVELHGGRVEVTSHLRIGTAITLWLPGDTSRNKQ